jgi:hypothetical protein
MRYSIIAAFVLIGFHAFARTKPATTQPATTQPTANGNTSYRNDEHRFRLEYPKTWQWRDDVPACAAFFAGPLDEDGTRPIVQITVLNIPERKPDEMEAMPLTLATVSDGMVNTLQRTVQDAYVQKVEDVKLGGNDAKCITYTGTFHDDTYKFIQHVCLMEKKIYVVTYANLEEHSESAMELVKGMVESFAVEK